MWDTVQTTPMALSHDMPCGSCGHAPHTYLACGDECECVPGTMPGISISIGAYGTRGRLERPAWPMASA